MQSSSKVVKIYIPRVISTIENKVFNKTFQNKGIGEVVYIDTYKRSNAATPYKFAFINLKLFETPNADEFLKSIKKEPTNIFYDSENTENYWVVKMHLDRENRDTDLKCKNTRSKSKRVSDKKKSNKIDIVETSVLNASAKPWIPAIAFEHYANGLDMEYDELQHEIYEMCCNSSN